MTGARASRSRRQARRGAVGRWKGKLQNIRQDEIKEEKDKSEMVVPVRGGVDMCIRSREKFCETKGN